MLQINFVLIKLSVITFLLNYDDVIIIIYKMQVIFISRSKIVLIIIDTLCEHVEHFE